MTSKVTAYNAVFQAREQLKDNNLSDTMRTVLLELLSVGATRNPNDARLYTWHHMINTLTLDVNSRNALVDYLAEMLNDAYQEVGVHETCAA